MNRGKLPQLDSGYLKKPKANMTLDGVRLQASP